MSQTSDSNFVSFNCRAASRAAEAAVAHDALRPAHRVFMARSNSIACSERREWFLKNVETNRECGQGGLPALEPPR